MVNSCRWWNAFQSMCEKGCNILHRESPCWVDSRMPSRTCWMYSSNRQSILFSIRYFIHPKPDFSTTLPVFSDNRENNVLINKHCFVFSPPIWSRWESISFEKVSFGSLLYSCFCNNNYTSIFKPNERDPFKLSVLLTCKSSKQQIKKKKKNTIRFHLISFPKFNLSRMHQ